MAAKRQLSYVIDAHDLFGIHDLWLFVLSGLLLNVTPGPDTLYIVGRGSTQGFGAGAVAALGIGTGALVHICAAALGLSALLAASATAFTALKIIGAAYLIYVGITLIRSHTAAQSPTSASDNRPLHEAYFFRAFSPMS
jgi:threonine/homoserine/homoserine lactone efflux protein